MKSQYILKILIVSILLLILHAQIDACNICGCATGGMYSGVLPNLEQNRVGINYSLSSFNHPASNSLSNGQGYVMKDHFHQVDLDLRYYPLSKFQLRMVLPYRQNLRVSDVSTESVNGLGDVELQAAYMFVNNSDSLYKVWRHTGFVGIATQLPTGQSEMRDQEKLLYPGNFQPGRGTWSNSAILFYSIRRGSLGMNLNAKVMTSGTNDIGFHAGNRTEIYTSLFYWLKQPKLSLVPSISLGYENMEQDEYFKLIDEHSGAQFWFGGVGCEGVLGNWTVNAYAFRPLAEQLNGQQPSNDLRLRFGFGIIIP